MPTGGALGMEAKAGRAVAADGSGAAGVPLLVYDTGVRALYGIDGER